VQTTVRSGTQNECDKILLLIVGQGVV